MNELRSEWTAEQVRENLGAANEGLPAATTTDRFPREGTASGMDFTSGEQSDDGATATEAVSTEGFPPDPPRRHQGGED